MTPLLALGAAFAIALPPALPPSVCTPVPSVDDDLRALWETGQVWGDFFDDVAARRELWVANWGTSAESVAPELVERARAVGGDWRILAIAIDGCSDSVSTLPYVARLFESVPNVDLRVVHPEPAAEVMLNHPTPDGRPATPTFLLLNSEFERVGCLVERPDPLRDRILANPDRLNRAGIYEWKMEWYADDEGRSTVAQMVETLEAASRGEMICAPATDDIPPQAH